MELVVGRIARAHGVTGELSVEVRTDDPDERFAVGSVLTGRLPRGGGSRRFTVESVREHSGRLLIRFAGVSDRDAADALRGTLFMVDTTDLPPIEDPDEFYDHQLEGLAVRTLDGTAVGTVSEVLHTPGGELLSVRGSERREILVPFVSAIVTSISLADKVIEIDPRKGCWICRENPVMKIDVVTIFPEYLQPVRQSLPGKAIDAGLVDVAVHDLRRWTHDVHKSVDDSPYGGGPGMVMKPTVWGDALDEICTSETLLVVPTPAGYPFTQETAWQWSTEDHLVIACGRYEGIDQRVADDAATRMRVREVSIGDYVLNGGEAAALVIIEAVLRLVPGVLGNALSAQEDSHSEGMASLLEGPSYTRPPSWRGMDVPPVLLSGDHAKIAAWRAEQSRQRTIERRPDLLGFDSPTGEHGGDGLS